MIRVAIFDDSREQREGLEAVLHSVPDLVCAGAFASARNAARDVAACTPDVVLMDIDMPGIDGIEATAVLRTRFPKLPIIMLTVIEDDDRIFAAISAGADGYFLKQTEPMRIIEGVHEVLKGGAPMTPSVARRVLRLMKHGLEPTPASTFQLTEREQQVLSLLVLGHTYKHIADDLGIAYATVNKHVSNVYSKLRVQSASEAVALALKKGLV